MSTPEGRIPAPQEPPGSAKAIMGVPRHKSVTGQATDVQIATGIGTVTAISGRTASATAVGAFYLYDGSGAAGDIVAIGAASPGGAFNPSCGVVGLPFRTGLFLHVVSGSVDLTVTWLPSVNPF